MPQLLSRALSCAARTQSTLPQQLVRIRTTYQPISQAASISYKADPRAVQRAAKSAASTISKSARPLSREPLPPPTMTPEALQSMPYIIRRTAFAQLPVYRKWMAGGTKEIILIKKINGDRSILAQELKEKLEIPQDNIRHNPTTGNLEIKVCFH